MNVTVIGRGLIGGSFLKAALRSGHRAVAYDRGETPEAAAEADIVLVAVPPSQVEPVMDLIAPRLKAGAVVVDATGVKSVICAGLSRYAGGRFVFVGGHPMAGRERTGFANATAELFDGASMILTPFPGTDPAVIERLDVFFRGLGFARTVVTDPAHHDEMIAFTSQLCHLISSAYAREPLARDHSGYSAGSYRDMVRVGAPDPDVWTELFFANREALLPVLERYIARLENFRGALAAGDRARLHADLVEGVAAKTALRE